MTTPSGLGRYGVDPDDLLYAGPGRPAGDELFDPEARWGRLSPLVYKLDGAYGGIPLGFTQTGDAAAATGLANIPAGAMSADIQVQGAAIRYTFDGTTPTAAVGHRADAGTTLHLALEETLRGFQFIKETATAVSLAVTYWS